MWIRNRANIVPPGPVFNHASTFSSYQKSFPRPRETRIRIISAVMASCTTTKACSDERVQDISLGWVAIPLLETCLFVYNLSQNPDEPDKQPSLQSYELDLNQTGPMVSGFSETSPLSAFPCDDLVSIG